MSTLHHHQGFTLIEMMIAVTVMIILSVVAVSTYQSSLKKNYRKEAQAQLRDLAGLMEKSFYQQNKYQDLSANATALTTASKRYQFAVNLPSVDSYQLTATLKSGFNDGSCGSLIVKSIGELLPKECW